MFRAAIVTVVLLFAAGPSASLFCKAWCDPYVAAENGCHHPVDGGGASLGSDESCDDSAHGAGGILKEDLRRAPAQEAGAGVSHARLESRPRATRFVQAWTPGRPPSDLTQPQTTPLRI